MPDNPQKKQVFLTLLMMGWKHWENKKIKVRKFDFFFLLSF
jgi:hypothetical protein